MDKRTTLALLLMAALLMIYPAIFMRHEPEQQKAPQKTEAPAVPTKAPETPSLAGAAAAVPVPPKDVVPVPDRIAEIESPLYHAEINSVGGQLRAWELRYRGEKPFVVAG